jgi:hypothetical protein
MSYQACINRGQHRARKATLFCLAPLLLIPAVAQADELSLEESLKSLFDQALQINIVARVIPQGEAPAMLVERSKLTIPGKAVAVRFQGTNLRVQANLTPYLLADGKLMLVAQGEVWLSEPSAKDAVQYLSSIRSLPIEVGEKIFFYPLGIPKPVQGTNSFSLALEIQIVPLKNAQDSAKP